MMEARTEDEEPIVMGVEQAHSKEDFFFSFFFFYELQEEDKVFSRISAAQNQTTSEMINTLIIVSTRFCGYSV